MNWFGGYHRINKPKSMETSVSQTVAPHPIAERTEPVHPGIQLRQLLKAICMPQVRLAELMQMQSSQLSEILSARRPINMSTAMLLEAVFDIPADVWIRMQNEYDEYYFLHDEESLRKYNWAHSHARLENGKYVDAVHVSEVFQQFSSH